MAGALQGRVAVVTGGSRGVGKGIAVELGAAGATVYVTGRTVEADPAEVPGTVVAAADAVTRAGGRGIAVPCDHRDDTAVKALFQQVRAEQGRLDLLVNNVYAAPGPQTPAGIPFWELPLAAWDSVHIVGLRSHYVASVFAVPLLFATGGGLIVNLSSPGAVGYLFNVPYGVSKAAVDRLTADMAQELKPHGVAVVSVRPGPVRTERTLAHPRPNERITAAERESARFVGRAVVALAADRRVLDRTGGSFTTLALAADYGFHDPERPGDSVGE
jgi:NAD(P)-dependent dehydrogenase (short-subunit alcohol dehydrogenase family)